MTGDNYLLIILNKIISEISVKYFGVYRHIERYVMIQFIIESEGKIKYISYNSQNIIIESCNSILQHFQKL